MSKSESLPKDRIVRVLISPRPPQIELVDNALRYTYCGDDGEEVYVWDIRSRIVEAWAEKRNQDFRMMINWKANLSFHMPGFEGQPELSFAGGKSVISASFSILTLTTNEGKSWEVVKFHPRWFKRVTKRTQAESKMILLALTHEERQIVCKSTCNDPKDSKVITWAKEVDFKPIG